MELKYCYYISCDYCFCSFNRTAYGIEIDYEQIVMRCFPYF